MLLGNYLYSLLQNPSKSAKKPGQLSGNQVSKYQQIYFDLLFKGRVLLFLIIQEGWLRDFQSLWQALAPNTYYFTSSLDCLLNFLLLPSFRSGEKGGENRADCHVDLSTVSIAWLMISVTHVLRHQVIPEYIQGIPQQMGAACNSHCLERAVLGSHTILIGNIQKQPRELTLQTVSSLSCSVRMAVWASSCRACLKR